MGGKLCKNITGKKKIKTQNTSNVKVVMSGRVIMAYLDSIGVI